MNAKILLWSILMLPLMFLNAQTTIYSENFEAVSQSFTLNSSDQSSSVGTGGSNYWVVNNAYNGGTGTLNCLGFPFSFTVNSTQAQPAGITNNPSSKYMHIASAAAVSSGINCASFTAADGLCNFDENNFAKMSADFSTIGFDSVEFSFYWLCAGGAQSYGELYYSTNSGNTWQLVSTPSATLNNQSNWIQRKVSLPDFEQKATLRFGFRFVNQTTSAASDPSLSVDEIQLKGFSLVPAPTISSPSFNGNAFCPGDVLNVNYTITGIYNSGNAFTVQLSDATGSFVSPVAIGQITSQTAGTIIATIPNGTAAGTGYRIRVVSSNPNIVGSDNGSNLSVAAGPVAGVASSGLDTICSGNSTTVILSGASGSIVWEESTNGTAFTASNYIGNSFNTGILSQSVYLRAIVINSCGSDTSNIIYIHVNPSPTAAFSYSQGTGLDVTFTNNSNGTFNSSNWNFGNGNQSTNENPVHIYSSAGAYSVSLTVSNSFGCSSIFVDTINIFPVSVNLTENQPIDFNVFPNPNSGQFTIEINLLESQHLAINLLDVLGRNISTLINATLSEGSHSFNNDLQLSSGIYLIEIKNNENRQLRKLIVK